MKINLNQVYIGNIEKVVDSDAVTFLWKTFENPEAELNFDNSETYKENACLIRVNEESNLFVDMDNIKSVIEKFKLRKIMGNIGKKPKFIPLGEFAMETTGYTENELYVDLNSIKTAFSVNEESKKVSLRKIKKEIKNKNISK